MYGYNLIYSLRAIQSVNRIYSITSIIIVLIIIAREIPWITENEKSEEKKKIIKVCETLSIVVQTEK